MDFSQSQEQDDIQRAIEALCARFDADYWLKRDNEGGFPLDFHAALAEAGWLGVAMPQEYGGAGLGISEAAVVMRTIAESGAGMSGASAVHMNIFGLHPVVVNGTDEQKKRLQERVSNPEKHWKFNHADLEERKLWENYIEAFETMLAATCTGAAPWYIVPANHKWYRNFIIARHIVDALHNMKLKTPPGPAGINFDTLKIE